MKKQIIKEVLALGGQASYSGRAKALFISGLTTEQTVKIMEKYPKPGFLVDHTVRKSPAF